MTVTNTYEVIRNDILPKLYDLRDTDSDNFDKYDELIHVYEDGEEALEKGYFPYKLMHGPLMFLKISNDHDSQVYRQILAVSRTYYAFIREVNCFA